MFANSFCSVPVGIVEVSILLTNLAVIIHIFKNRKKTDRQFFLYGCLFWSNMLSTLSISATGILSNSLLPLSKVPQTTDLLAGTATNNVSKSPTPLLNIPQPTHFLAGTATNNVSKSPPLFLSSQRPTLIAGTVTIRFSGAYPQPVSIRSTPILVVASCLTIDFNCFFNVALAYFRLCVVQEPFKYSSAYAMRRLSRKLGLAAVIATLLLTSLTTVLAAMTTVRNIDKWSIVTALLSTYSSLCIIYIKLLHEYITRNKNLVQVSENGGNREMIEGRRRHERYLTKIFIGMTTSFFVCNLPFIVIMLMFPTVVIPSCESIEGKVSIISACFSRLNMIFDPLWFYISVLRMTRRHRARVSPQNGGANIARNQEN